METRPWRTVWTYQKDLAKAWREVADLIPMMRHVAVKLGTMRLITGVLLSGCGTGRPRTAQRETTSTARQTTSSESVDVADLARWVAVWNDPRTAYLPTLSYRTWPYR